MKIPWYVIFLSGVLVGFLAFCKGCKREPQVITQTYDTTTTVKIDLVIAPELVAEIPKPYEVVKYIPTESDPPDFNLDQMRTYIDTAVFDGLTLGYEIKTRGELKGAIFRPTFERETIIKEITTTNTIDNTKKLRGLYLGVTIGGNKSEFGTLAPGAYYVAPRVIVGYNYNLIEGGHNVTVGRKLF